MGKIKREKITFHTKAPKLSNKESKIPYYNPQVSGKKLSIDTNFPSSPIAKDIARNSLNIIKSNIFQNVRIPVQSLHQKLDNTIEKSVVEQNTVSRGPNLSKIGVRRARHKAFIKKLESAKCAERELLEAKKRRATPVVGDMRVLTDALPALDELPKIPNAVQKRNTGKMAAMSHRWKLSKEVDWLRKQYQRNSTISVDVQEAFKESIKTFLNTEQYFQN